MAISTCVALRSGPRHADLGKLALRSDDGHLLRAGVLPRLGQHAKHGQLMARSEQALDIRMAQMHMARDDATGTKIRPVLREDLFRSGKLDLSLDLRFLHAVPPHFCTVFRTMPS